MKVDLLRKIIKWTGVSLLLLSVAYFSLRVLVLDTVLSKVKIKLEERYGWRLSIDQRGMSGISTIWFSGIRIVPAAGDTLLQIDTLAVRPSFFSFIMGRPGFGYLEMDRATLRLSSKDGTANYCGKKQNQSAEIPNAASVESSYAKLLNNLLSQAFSLAPQRSHLSELHLEVRSDTLRADLLIPEFISTSQDLHATLVDLSSGRSWQMKGDFQQGKRTFDVSIYPLQRDRILPVIGSLFGASLGFDTLRLALNLFNYSSDELELQGVFSVKGLSLHHPKIAADTVKLPFSKFDYHFSAGSGYLQIDSTSSAVMDRMVVHPFLRIDRQPQSVYTLRLHTDTLPANDFFASLPQGMFDEVRGIRADGKLCFQMNFRLPTSSPDNVVFDCRLQKEKFRLRSLGASNIAKMNGEFVYDVFENERYIRSITIGPTNPDFTSVENVSANFKNAVLTSEDGSFFYHNGFNEDAFRKSIAANYKAGKFVRGGSTITMQLVKNVFLTRRKTIARKAEEALIVWLIESNRLVSKDRMLEVYFNIIELGPNVYGIGEASRFYFNKSPQSLELSEGIFLASLLPHPKWFRSSFDTTGSLKPYMADYYRVVSNFMLRKNLIDQIQHDALLPNVVLTGPAKDYLLPKDTLIEQPVDQLE